MDYYLPSAYLGSMKKLKFLFFPTILALAFGLMLSCAKSSSTDSNNQSQCTSVTTFQKGIYGKQAKQTNDCVYIVAYNGKLTKLDERGETKWESKITLYQSFSDEFFYSRLRFH